MKIGVYGLGRFGFFWASLLSKDFEVAAYSRDPGRPCPENVARVAEEEVCLSDALFLCNSISSLKETLPRIAKLVKPGALVADTCSVKVYPVRLMEECFSESVHLLGTHPMFGPDSAKNGLKGLPLVYYPIRMSKEKDAYWQTYFRGLELEVVRMTPEEHDKQAAYTQGVTHFLGRALNDMALAPNSIGTMGYRSLLAIIEQTCNDPWQLFLDLQQFNPYTGEMRESLKKSLEKMMAIIARDPNTSDA